MTLKELSQLYWLNREIEMDQQRLEALEGKIGPASPNLTGMPHGTGGNTSKTEKYAVEIADLQAIIAAKQIQCIHERARLERYIEQIEDSETRMIFTLRFVNGLPWGQVAAHIGAGNTGDRVKKVCYRYLDKTEQAEEAQAIEEEIASLKAAEDD